jgi:hypothetical protein
MRILAVLSHLSRAILRSHTRPLLELDAGLLMADVLGARDVLANIVETRNRCESSLFLVLVRGTR